MFFIICFLFKDIFKRSLIADSLLVLNVQYAFYNIFFTEFKTLTQENHFWSTTVIEIFFNSVFTENVALNKTAFHTSALNEGKYDPRNAVDLSRDGGQCTATTYSKQTATWWVHLKDMHFVNHITIYFMTDNKTLGT